MRKVLINVIMRNMYYHDRSEYYVIIISVEHDDFLTCPMLSAMCMTKPLCGPQHCRVQKPDSENKT